MFFTVSDVQSGTSGVPISFNRTTIQRLIINDSDSQWNLGMSFTSTSSYMAKNYSDDD